MINTNSTVFKVASCVASAFVAVAVTILTTNKLRNGGIFNFKTPVSTDVGAKLTAEDKAKAKEAEDKAKEAEEVEYNKSDVYEGENLRSGFTKDGEIIRDKDGKVVKLRG